MKRVCIDVGHTPTEFGASNAASGALEYHQNVKLANLLAVWLHRLQMIPVIVYRETYAGLPALINQTSADICISVHANAADAPTASGTETLYCAGSVLSKKLADIIQSYMHAVLDIRDRGIKPIYLSDRGGSLVSKTIMAHVIIEPYFLSNDDDLRIANARMEQLASNIAEGCDEYFNE